MNKEQVGNFLPEDTPARSLTAEKTAHIVKTFNYGITGFVLTNADGDICIVDKSAVRWIKKADFWNLMHG